MSLTAKSSAALLLFDAATARYFQMKAENPLADRIREVRRRSRLTQKSLAAALSITSQAVNQWESGASVPSMQNLQRLADLTRTDIGWLLTGEHLIEQSVNGSLIAFSEGGRFVPMISVEQALARVPASDESPKYYAHFPCSSKSFIVSLPNESNAPTHPAGTRWVIDPEQKPRPGDLVFAAVDGAAAFGEYLTESNPQGRVQIVRPLNSKWGAHRSDLERIEIIGRVTEYSRQA